MKVYHVKKARKDNPVAKRGESYYWWKFAFGPKMFSKEYPKRSQLTNSTYLSTIYEIEDGLKNRFNDFDTLEDDVQNLIEELQELRDECEGSLENMPEPLRDTSDSAITLTERIDALDSATSELESISFPDYEDEETEETEEEWKKGKLEEIKEEIFSYFPIS